MKKLLLALGILALICSPALAGKNAGGALVVHTNDAIPFTGTANYCLDQYNPASCEDAVTQSNKDDATEALIWFLAAFPPNSNPAVTGIQFGVRHNLPPGQGYVAHWGVCGPLPQQLPDPGFPDTPGGNLVGFGSPVMDQFFPFYWFGAYGFEGAFFGTGVYPGDGLAKFADDSVPPVEDLINKFGEVRWYVPGFNDCPGVVQEPEACCFADGTCQMLLAEDCAAQGGTAQGAGTVCQPNPCAQPEACCFEDFSCQMLLADLCTQQGGTPQGAGSTCEPNNPCLPTPTGACCVGEACSVVTALECENMGGVYQGDGSACEPNPCLIPRGACCIGEVCSIETEANCLGAGGQYYGDGTTCDGIDCVPVPTESKTWGQIKANYR